MYNTTKVKTYQPIIPAGKGPIFLTVEDAVKEIIIDLDSKIQNVGVSTAEFEKFVQIIVDGLKISEWIDGEYTIFVEYNLKIHTYQQAQLNKMDEFDGY